MTTQMLCQLQHWFIGAAYCHSWQRSVKLGYKMNSALEQSFAANVEVMLMVYSVNVSK